MDKVTVTYVLKNDMGGITSFIKNLIDYAGPDALKARVIFLNIENNTISSFEGEFVENVPTTILNYSSKNNWYHSFRKLKQQIGDENGVLISNDMYDLIMLTHFNINKKVIQIIHDGYNIKLAVHYHFVVDSFICHSHYFYEMLCQLLPDRRSDIHFIQYGIPLASNLTHKPKGDALKLVFVGRHNKMKGIFDLFEINTLLKQRQVFVDWLILGNGPDKEELKTQWKDEDNVKIYTAASSAEVLKLCSERHIMVFPTKFEGFPVAMVEAMGVGCVPVVSDLPGGIRELSANGDNAILCQLNNNNDFADAIESLYKKPAKLAAMSHNCVNTIIEKHDAKVQSPVFQQLFKKIALNKNLPRHHKVKNKLGSRLDQAFIPNFITRKLRAARK